jgi:hypothetical protein
MGGGWRKALASCSSSDAALVGRQATRRHATFAHLVLAHAKALEHVLERRGVQALFEVVERMLGQGSVCTRRRGRGEGGKPCRRARVGSGGARRQQL